MTKQEVFDIVYKGLAAQGWVRSISNDGGCAYRGNEGRKCAAGYLFSDADLEKMEPIVIAHRYWDSCVPEAQVKADVNCKTSSGHIIQHVRHDLAEHITFISRLQAAHDQSRTAEYMKRQFDRIAVDQGLTIPNVNASEEVSK